MIHHEWARSTNGPTTEAKVTKATAAVWPALGFLLGLVLLTLALSTSTARAKEFDSTDLELFRYSLWLKSLGPGFDVAQGNVFLMTNDQCPTFVSVFKSCFGQNPAAPYIVPQPPVGNSYVDPYYATPFNTPGPHNQNTNIFYRLSDQEALVTIVSYPPKAAYLGYVSYAFTRESSEYVGITPPRPPTVSPDSNRYELFGSIGNGVNNVTVKNQLGFSPWNRAVVVYVTTSNTNLAAAIIKSARKHFIDPKSIFVEPIGSNMHTGNDSSADDMVTLMRYAIPKSTNAADDWTSSLSRNVLVYKVSNTTLAVKRYGEISYTPHIVNNPETASLQTAEQQLASLLQGYLTQKQFPLQSEIQPFVVPTTVTAEGVPNGGLVGSVCIYYGVNCLGDSQDTNTYNFTNLRTIDPQETAFVVGVNHAVPQLNNARYVSVGVFNAANESGVASASQTNPQAIGFDSGSLDGSAKGILKALGIAIPPAYTALKANLSNLYAVAVARNINNSTIAPAAQYAIDLKGTSLIPLNTPIQIQGRAYICPGTTAGGNVAFMLNPLIVVARKDLPPSE